MQVFSPEAGLGLSISHGRPNLQALLHELDGLDIPSADVHVAGAWQSLDQTALLRQLTC